MTRSGSALEVVGDGEQERGFVVASWSVNGGNTNAGSFRRAVDVEEVMNVLVVFWWDSRIFHRFWFDFCFCFWLFSFYPCSYSCSCSCSDSSLFPYSNQNSFSGFHRISWVMSVSSVHPLSPTTLVHSGG